MFPFQPSFHRRRPVARLAPEVLESRALLTAGAGNLFAIVPGHIDKAGQVASVSFTIDPAHFTLPRGKMVLGIDVVQEPNSALKPMITSINDARGHLVSQALHSTYDPKLPRNKADGLQTSAVIANLSIPPHQGNKPFTFSVHVLGQHKTTGKFLLGFFLPGDANGDGVVDQTDVKAIQAAKNTKPGDPKYNFNADANRDGRIGAIDVSYAQQNLGVKTTISPILTSNVDPASTGGRPGRVTSASTVHITGAASPGASITYAEKQDKVQTVTDTVDSTGNYSLMVPVAPGSNTFHVSTTDAFGQSISGDIAPISSTATASPNPIPPKIVS